MSAGTFAARGCPEHKRCPPSCDWSGADGPPLKLGIFEGRAGGFLGTATAFAPDGGARTSPEALEPGDRIILDADDVSTGIGIPIPPGPIPVEEHTPRPSFFGAEPVPVLDEEGRQMLLLALASLSIERPGFDYALNRIALVFDRVKDGRGVLYDEFRRIRGKK